MRIIFILLLLLSCQFFTNAQVYNQKLVNNQNGEEILIGLCNRAGFQQGQYKEWFDEEYGYYNTIRQIKLLDSLKGKMDSIKMIVVLGTWCSDSRLQFPRMMGMLDYIGFSEKNQTIICVDRMKKTLSDNIDSLKVLLVPSFIFYKNSKEIGRITESPAESLEADLYKIIRWRKDINGTR